MIKMIISGVDTENFLDVATAITRMHVRENYGVYSEFSLGEYADGNSVDANLIDFNTLDAISKLQMISPAEIHFEATGGESSFDGGDTYDEELFNDALKELYRGKNYTIAPLDIFTDIVNAHSERVYA